MAAVRSWWPGPDPPFISVRLAACGKRFKRHCVPQTYIHKSRNKHGVTELCELSVGLGDNSIFNVSKG